jgi:hypothetical protein
MFFAIVIRMGMINAHSHSNACVVIFEKSYGTLHHATWVLVSPVGGPHSVRGVVGTAVVCNHRKTGVYNAQQWGLVYSRFFFK